jgi:drug/metabolite transporter (DMT)-like permease
VEWPLFAGAIAAGGILAPVLLMFGLRAMPASNAALLLNAEGVFTAVLAWFAFRENFDRRVATGMAAIVAGAATCASGRSKYQRPLVNVTDSRLWNCVELQGDATVLGCSDKPGRVCRHLSKSQ